MESIIFELTKKIRYANNSGAEIECDFIELREPTGKVSHICNAIEGMIQSGIIKMGDVLGDDVKEQAKEAAAEKKLTEDSGAEKDGGDILAVIMSSGIDMDKLTLHFKELFKEVAWMGGEKQITSARLNELSHNDLKRMIGKYASNFILS